MRCPICNGHVAPLTPDGPLPPQFPFCSERCRYVDLGRWFTEDYKVTRAVEEEDLPEAPPID